MSNPHELLAMLRGLGIVLTLDNDRLLVNAPKGVITPELRQALVAQKSAVVDLLRQTPLLSDDDTPSGSLPLSYSQQRLWFFAQLEPEDPVYNVAVAMRLTGELNRSALEQSLHAILARHESLRTSFHEVHGKPRSAVLAQTVWNPGFVDLSLLSPAEAEEEAARFATIEARKPFILEVAPLLRATLIRIAPRAHLLVLIVHHIVADGWSLGIIAKELGSLYAGFIKDAASEEILPPLALQFRDYVRWEQGPGEQLASAQIPFWLERLAGILPIIELPTDRRRPAVQTFDGRRLAVALPPALADGLRALCRESGTTPFMLLLAAFKVLVFRYTGIEDVLIGSGTSNRHRQEFGALVGFFVNNLVLRTSLAEDPSFRELLARVQQTALSAYAHQDVPFNLLVEKLQPERSMSQSPLVQVIFNLQNVPMEALALPGLAVAPQPLDAGISRADLSVEVWPDGEGYRCDFEYNTNLFDEATVRQMQAHFLRIVSEAVRDPAQPIGRMSLLSAEEREQTLVAWNDTSAEYPQLPIPAIFAGYAASTPDAIALRYPDGELSYKALDEFANGIAHRLVALGLAPHSFVAVAAEGHPLAMAAFLGILKAGHAYLPVSPTESVDRLQTLLGTASATVLLKVNAGPRFASLRNIEQIDLDGILSSPTPPSVSPPSIDDPAYLMFTSGSTGEPKGVIVPHRGIVRLVKGDRSLDFNSGAVVAQINPLSFDGSTFEIWGALLNGATLVMFNLEQRGPEEVRAAVCDFGVTTLAISSALFHATADDHLEELRPLRQLLVGGDVLSTAHIRRLLEHLPHLHLVNAYGPTENTTNTCTHAITLDSLDGGPIPIGRPISNTAVFILDQLGQPVPCGVCGELYASGDGLAIGYLSDPRQTAEKFVQLSFPEIGLFRAYRTGDLARFRRDGVIEFLGRRDRQVKLRGYRVDLAEIEQAILRDPDVRSAIATIREAPGAAPMLTAYIVLADAAAVTPQQLRRQLRTILPAHAVPSELVPVPEIPRTENGKTDFARLEAFAVEARRSPIAAEPFASDTERKLASLFASLLNVDRVSVDDDFFALGGHSLLVKQLIARVNDVFNVKLPVATVFHNSTVQAIAREIDAAQVSMAAPATALPSGEMEHPLSRSQSRLWFLDQLDPSSPAYNIAIAFTLDGPLDEAAFDRTLKALVQRHETLRTSFLQRDGTPFARIAAAPQWSPAKLDLRGLPVDDLRAEVLRIVRAEAETPFQLECGPLFRALFVREHDTRYVAVLVMHHIISDGWSIGVLSREIGMIYAAFATGSPLPLQPLRVQFRHFVERERLDAETSFAADIGYWKRQLGGELPMLELPSDRPRPPRQSFQGKRLILDIPAALADGLERVSRSHNATLFMTALAAFALLLRRYSGQEQLLIGTPVAGRVDTQLEDVVGFFVNNLVLRLDLNGDPDFATLLDRVRRTTLDALQHQSVQFDQLVEALQPERRLDRAPIFQVMFALQNAPMKALSIAGIEIASLDFQGSRARYDLTVDLYPFEDRYRCDFEYNTDLFDEATILQMQVLYLRVLQQLAVSAAGSVSADPASALTLLGGAERQLVLHDWNQTATEALPFATFPEGFLTQAARTPEAVAVQMHDRALTYAQLDHRSAQLSRQIRQRALSLGIEKLVIGIYLNRSLEMVVALLAVLRSGAAYLPLDPALPKARLEYILADAAVPLILTSSERNSSIPADIAGEVMLVNHVDATYPNAWHLPETLNETDILALPAPEDLAYLIYTSGSTGDPKGTAISHAALANLLGSMLREPGLTACDTMVAVTTLSFDIAALELFGPLLCGAKLVLASREHLLDPPLLAALLDRSAATVMQATPSTWRMLVESGWMGRSDLRLWCGGEPLHTDLAEALLVRGRELWNLYGPTETTVWSTVHQIRNSAGPISIGRPIANTTTYILDEARQPVPVGVPGELYIGGAGLAVGYWQRPELTASRFVPDPFVSGARMYRTGDLARYLRDGSIQLIGRTDDQVKLRGHRIELGEIESVLARHPLVSHAVASVQGEAHSRQLVAFIKPGDSNEDIDLVELRAWAFDRLPEYMVPTTFVPLASIPVTPNGKVDRKRLPLLERSIPVSSTAGILPRNETERKIAEVWSELLGLDHIGVQQNFFDIGGHSMLLMRIHARLCQQFDPEIRVVDLFRYPTIESMAAWLERRRAASLVTGVTS